MNTLKRYVEVIVDPTWDEFQRNTGSARHAFLTAVAIYHAIDRAVAPSRTKVGNLRKEWANKSFDFMLVDILAHHFKHVQSHDEKNPRGWEGIPIGFALGFGDLGETMDLRNLYYVLRDAVKFLHMEVAEREAAEAGTGGEATSGPR